MERLRSSRAVTSLASGRCGLVGIDVDVSAIGILLAVVEAGIPAEPRCKGLECRRPCTLRTVARPQPDRRGRGISRVLALP